MDIIKAYEKNACSGGTWKYETSSWKEFGLKTYLSIVNIQGNRTTVNRTRENIGIRCDFFPKKIFLKKIDDRLDRLDR